MIWLILGIAGTSLIYVLFKEFEQRGIHTFPAIVINYFTAMAWGGWFVVQSFEPSEFLAQSYSWPMLALGIVFISIFYMMALTAQRLGVSVSSVASKMALVVPVIVFVILDEQDTMGVMKIAGVVLAIGGVWFTSYKSGDKAVGNAVWILPLVVFLGSGLLDTVIGWYSSGDHNLSDADNYLISTLPFSGAAIIGLVILFIRYFQGSRKLGVKEVAGGILLGTTNFASIFFLVKSVSVNFLPKSALFPIYNLGIILLATIISVIRFRERLTDKNKLGILLAVMAIVLFWVADN